MISLSVEVGRELEDLAPVLGLLDLKNEESVMDDGEPGQGDGAESSGVGPGQLQEDVAWVAILGDDDLVEGDQVDGEDGAEGPGQGGEGVSTPLSAVHYYSDCCRLRKSLGRGGERD